MQVRFGSQARPRVPVRQFFENTASTLKFGPHARFLIQARLNDITAEYLPKAVTAAPADFDKVYDEFLEKLNAANAARAGELMTVMVKEQAEWYTDFNK